VLYLIGDSTVVIHSAKNGGDVEMLETVLLKPTLGP
jgi:hypothetical protein